MEKKIVFQGNDSDLFISTKVDQIRIEMIDSGVSLNDYQLGDSYNIILLNKAECIDLANELLKLSNDAKE